MYIEQCGGEAAISIDMELFQNYVEYNHFILQ
jgi:hypothetical protein